MRVTLGGRTRDYRPVWFDGRTRSVRLIDQRLLPHEFKVVALPDYRATARAIRDMIVRGAPAIAATAAYGFAQGAGAFRGRDPRQFTRHLDTVFRTLQAARPTAVDPVNAMNQLRAQMTATSVVEQQRQVTAAAADFANTSAAECRAIGEQGAKLIRNGMRILTHCNAGWLACVDFGTATAPLYVAQERGRRFHVLCDETRPRCQGATLTAWELAQAGIPHQVIADSAAGHLMQRREIDVVIVGSDRTLGRTGEVANKIGTYTLAVLAARHRIPFYVALPLSTLDWTLRSGRDIPIEERVADEVLGAWGVVGDPKARGRVPRRKRPVYVRVANPGSAARNPGFDVTPPELVTGITTPVGIFDPRQLWRNRRTLGGPA